MNPKEKVEELVILMKNCLYSDGIYDAKQCAFVAIEAIIEALYNCGIVDEAEIDIAFYTEVKKELENL